MKLFISFFIVFSALVSHAQMQIPNIKNKQAITVVVEKGHWTKYLKENLAPNFTKQTGVPVNIVEVALENMHALQDKSLENADGNYDLLSLEAGWAKEWGSKGYTIPLGELAKKYEKKQADWDKYINSFYPSLFEILSYDNEIHSIPYNTYVMANHYRLDLFESKIEQINFKKKYGYNLDVPKTLEELKDVSEFFTRKKGERLKGKVLEKDFYGVALMSGNKPHINDEWSAILWAKGGTWFKPIYKQNRLSNFALPKNHKLLNETANYYLNLMNHAYPVNESFAFLEAADALASGHVAMWPFAYNNLWAVSSKLNSKDDEQKFAIASTPGQKPYHGAYSFAVAYDSKNLEGAFWFLRFMTSKEGQIEYAKGGGNPTRFDANEYLSSSLDKNSAQYYSLRTTLEASSFWDKKIKNHGHYMSTTMGMIYPLLTKYSYMISSKKVSVKEGIESLLNEIRFKQNQYGEKAIFGQ